MNTNSSLYQELTLEELAAIVGANFGAGRPFTARLLDGGLFNTTYRISMESPAREVVLRMGPVHCELLLAYEENLMRAEEYVYRLFDGHGIPGSSVVVCDTSRKLIGRDYMIVDFIESVPLSAVEDKAASAQLFRQTGEYAARINAIEGEHFGRVSEILRGNSYPTWEAYLSGELAQTLAALGRYGLVTPGLSREITAAFAANSDVLRSVTKPCLSHCDLWGGNVLVRQDAFGTYEIKAIIDPDRAVFGDRDFDFASPWMVTPDFIAGYEAGGGSMEGKDSPETKRKLALYQLLFHLNDAYALKVEYNNDKDFRSRMEEIASVLRRLKEMNPN